MIQFKANIFNMPEIEKGTELAYRFLKTDFCRVEIIYDNEVSSQWLEDDSIEVAFLIQGTAVVEEKGSAKIVLSRGEGIKIEPKAKHRIVSTSADAIWMVVHTIKD